MVVSIQCCVSYLRHMEVSLADTGHKVGSGLDTKAHGQGRLSQVKQKESERMVRRGTDVASGSDERTAFGTHKMRVRRTAQMEVERVDRLPLLTLQQSMRSSLDCGIAKSYAEVGEGEWEGIREVGPNLFQIVIGMGGVDTPRLLTMPMPSPGPLHLAQKSVAIQTPGRREKNVEAKKGGDFPAISDEKVGMTVMAIGFGALISGLSLLMPLQIREVG
ncbi:hypothetical protein BDK51DRAFT_27719 [Blyttiomyces helicus]|uniref:Uncharacterized protein n=1 Tax=Blyttiomyces helicus TaxID=388810 RepID=A0A4P9W3P3_9FUNG|nr:hypothetical protein BDK51DRAFT_27719 [Blyttiomyces helicus]|eukprot:RKO86764.1 hypothetical protein BDK51DRAFT_27719 [Blyttiomyces helicus]